VSKPLLCRGLILILILSYHVFEILKLRNHQFWFSEQKCKIKEPLVHALAKLKEVPEPDFMKDLSKNMGFCASGLVPFLISPQMVQTSVVRIFGFQC
jgi:hypothetical protein